jgi:hypothetical protein
VTKGDVAACDAAIKRMSRAADTLIFQDDILMLAGSDVGLTKLPRE